VILDQGVWPMKVMRFQGLSPQELKTQCRALSEDERETAILSLQDLVDLPTYAPIIDALKNVELGNGLDREWSAPAAIRQLAATDLDQFNNPGGKKLDVKKLAEHLITELGPFALSPNLSRIYFYDRAKGVYRTQAEEYVLRPAVAAIMKGSYKLSTAQNVIDYLTATDGGQMRVLPTSTIGTAHLIPVSNGILDWSTGVLEPFSSDHLFTSKLRAAWDPEADCPLFLEALNTIFAGDQELIDYVFIMLACCIYGGKPSDAAGFFLAGGGRNGKSMLLNIFSAILDVDQVSRISPQDLDSTRFAVAELYGKLANISGDVSSTKFKESGMWKKITTGDVVPAEQKFQNPFSFISTATQIVSMNVMADTTDTSDGFFRRLRIVPFNIKFVDGEPQNHLQRRKDPRVETAILGSPTELSGILRRAVYSLRHMMDPSGLNGTIPESPAMREAKLQYMDSVDPVRTWLRSGQVHAAAPEVSTPRQALYLHFKEWALHTEGYAFTERPSKFALRLEAAAAEPTIGIIVKVEHCPILNQVVVKGLSLDPVCGMCARPLETSVEQKTGSHNLCVQPELLKVGA